MSAREQRVRAGITAEAAEWFVANRGAVPDAVQRDTFAAWLKSSPLHVEEYLAVALIARDLRRAKDDPQLSLEALLAEARSTPDRSVRYIGERPAERLGQARRGSWGFAAAAAAALGAVALALLWWGGDRASVMRFVTRHGEQISERLADSSTLRLDSDSAVTVRYSRTERLVEVERGQVLLAVTHEAARPFRVLAGPAEVRDVGTTFDVYRQQDTTLVTVLEGEVATSLARGEPGAAAGRAVRVHAGEQLRVAPGALPLAAERADTQRNTAWLRRQIVFEQEPLEKVAAEFNRYSARRIEIETPELRRLAISGTFTADDTESFIAFLRTLEGVRVEVTATRIRVSKM